MGLKDNLKLLYRRSVRAINQSSYKKRFLNELELFEKNELKNNNETYLNMIEAFCASGGKSNQEGADYLSRKYGRVDFSSLKDKSIFNLEKFDFTSIHESLNKNGWYILPQRLPDEMIDQLLHFAKNEPCIIRPVDGDQDWNKKLSIIDLAHLQSILYSVPEIASINNPLIQKIAGDYVFLEIAQNYLNVEPIWDVTSLWWSTNFSKKSDKNAAQWFHFDMDRIKWLKIFIYLTDVHVDNGPHTFVEGSHQDGGIPMALLAKGYKRLSDAEVSRQFKPAKLKEFTAPKGTILIEDTRGLHKGKNVTGSPRCLLQFQLSNSLFGASYAKSLIKDSSALKDIANLSPRFLSNYL